MNNKYNPQKKAKYNKVEALYKDGVPISRIETLTGITRKTIRIWLTASGQYKPSHNNNINRYFNNKGKTQPEPIESPQTLPQATKSHVKDQTGHTTPDKSPRPIDPIYIYPIKTEKIDTDIDNTEVDIGKDIDNQEDRTIVSDLLTTQHIATLDNIITKVLARLKKNETLSGMSGIQLAKALDVIVSKRVQLRQGNSTQQEASTFILQFINNRNFTGELKEIGQVKNKDINVSACE